MGSKNMAAVAQRTTGCKAPSRTHCIFLVCTVLGVLAGCEVAARYALQRISRIEKRTELERRAVLSMNKRSGSSLQVLVIGNSLLLEGIDFPSLQQSLKPEFQLVRYVVEQTAYLDWYYGMRALYSQGIHPDAVLLLLNAEQLASDEIRGDYFACRMMQARDVLSVSRDAGLSHTAAFGLLFARGSAFYGTRSETRKVLLSRVVPVIRELRPLLIPPEPPPADRQVVVRTAAERLNSFDTLVREHGGRFIFTEAPGLNPTDAASAREACERAGVPALVPLDPKSLSEKEFRDGFHMNPAGAARYTAALTPLLLQSLHGQLRMAPTAMLVH
jgi:hypothetical protein